MAMMAEKVIRSWQRPGRSRVSATRSTEILSTDTLNWKGVKGTILIRPDCSIRTAGRDRTASSDVFGSALWP